MPKLSCSSMRRALSALKWTSRSSRLKPSKSEMLSVNMMPLIG